jgi:hypothetical protein
VPRSTTSYSTAPAGPWGRTRAALASLALALAAWIRPDSVPVLAVDKTALAVLAAFVAALYVTAAVVAATA